MIEHILDHIAQLTPFWLLVVLTFFSYFENIFPPSPSDLVVVVGGSLIGNGVISFYPTLLLTTLGSVAGFMTIYYIGSTLDKKIVKTHKLKFIPTDGIEKVEAWFAKYGYWIIVANRFMPGTRSVISLFTGLSELEVKRTAILSTISALGWNAIILYLGIIFGSNVKKVDKLLETYSDIVLAITALAIIIYFIRYFIQKKKKRTNGQEEQNKDWLLLIASGILMGISFPPFPFPFQLLMLVGLVPYFLVIEKRTTLISLNRASYIMGFVFCLITLYWVGSWQKEADTFLMISGGLLIFVNPVFLLIPSTLLYFARDIFSKGKAIYLFPLFWITYEYLYMITDLSFPWLTLGSGLSHFNIFIQIADIVGAVGISMIVIYINIFIAKAIEARTLFPKSFRIHIGLAIGIILFVTVYGIFRISTFRISDEKVKVGLIQPNLDPWGKWSSVNLNELTSVYFDLSREAVKDGAKLIFWPETALPVYLREGGYESILDSIHNFLDKNNVTLITGMPDLVYYKPGNNIPENVKYNKAGNYYYATYNAVLQFSPNSRDIESYGKSKLVPFGERVPFVDQFPFLRDFIKLTVGISDWNIGRDTTVFKVQLVNKDTLRVNSLVCYESIYPYYIERFIDKGADLISVVTNDSWYGNSSGPYQHKEMSVLRAIENRKTVIRAANGGISCIIDPLGRTVTESNMFTKTQITGDVFIQKDETFFSKYPLILPVISSAFSLWIFGIFILKKLKLRLNL